MQKAQIPPLTGGIRAFCVSLRLGGLRLSGLRGRLGVVEHGLERELAAVIDLRDLHEDLLTDRENVVDVLDTLATGERAPR